MTLEDLPAVNASLNALTAMLISAGYVCVRSGKLTAHKALMLLAVLTSACFLASYLTHHLLGQPRRFQGTGWLRGAYLAVLTTHMALAAAVVPMVLTSLYHGLLNRVGQHVRIARWTLGIWLYVSVTGLVVYASLYSTGGHARYTDSLSASPDGDESPTDFDHGAARENGRVFRTQRELRGAPASAEPAGVTSGLANTGLTGDSRTSTVRMQLRGAE